MFMGSTSDAPQPLITQTETSFEFAVLAPAQILMTPDWEQMVWDETLKAADERGVLLVGPIHTTSEGYQRGANAKSQSGKPFPPEYGLLAMTPDSDIVVLRGEGFPAAAV